MILSLPAFDTYNTMLAYARDPENIDNLRAFKLLKRRARTRLVWDVLLGSAASFNLEDDTVEHMKNLWLGIQDHGSIATVKQQSSEDSHKKVDMSNPKESLYNMLRLYKRDIDPDLIIEDKPEK